ncbi:RNA polymerase II-associated protein 3 [Tribolium castaneum]|uniref:RNA polymerase II-associated protein 3 n=1 Tax=Tribolium castaneum TaxID=7070 RepID=D6WQY6_TRICA|nr:PREDICTED: RNA polymerase II-associated protein 3 [Tribolium castaneum]EFA06488.1 RNA polymerase II-associated protein 3-like Protein [Tribolium castaneum]|eukprot:XP_008195103.1 PREDICTED: RNA polymerase II-associated protein 3 [Tribolium castaneum]
MNPVLLQKQLRDNAADLNDFYKELKCWGEDMKKKEESRQTAPMKKPAVNGKVDGQIVKKKKTIKEKIKTKIGYTDYQAWDKFDADAECEKMDYSENDESELTDECDETTRDEAYLEKDKGNKFVKDKKWEQAIECYTKAIDLYSYDPIFYANRALCFLKIQNYEKAESDCTLSLKLDQTYVKAYQRRAAAREALNKLQDAKSDLLKVLELEPKNSESKTSLENLKKKLALVEKPVETSQRPVSKFTASRNKNLCKVVKQENNNESEPIILVKTVNKPVHLQSKKPLKRIEIQEISEIESFPKVDEPNVTLKTDDLKVVERQPLGQNVHEIKESKDQRNNIKMELSVPHNSVQFYSSWRHLKTLDFKYEYLKLINPENLPLIFKESLESSVFSEILEVLTKCFIERGDDVFDFLKYFTQIRRFSAIIMFLSVNDKNCLRKLIDYTKERGNYAKDDIDLLFQTYELFN